MKKIAFVGVILLILSSVFMANIVSPDGVDPDREKWKVRARGVKTVEKLILVEGEQIRVVENGVVSTFFIGYVVSKLIDIAWEWLESQAHAPEPVPPVTHISVTMSGCGVTAESLCGTNSPNPNINP